MAMALLSWLAGLAPAEPRRIEVHGHRGARARRPENTLPAFEYALSIGVDVLELDLQVTRDEQLVISHEPALLPTLCLGPGGGRLAQPVPIRSLSAEELRRYDCGAQVNPAFPRQRAVPGTPMP